MSKKFQQNKTSEAASRPGTLESCLGPRWAPAAPSQNVRPIWSQRSCRPASVAVSMYRDASRSVRCQRTALIQSGPWICNVCQRRWNLETVVGSSRPYAPADEVAISNIPGNDPANDRRCSDDEYWPIGMIHSHVHSTTALVRWMGARMRSCRRGDQECDWGGSLKPGLPNRSNV